MRVTALDEQQRLQVEALHRRRGLPWLPWLILLGLGLSAFGLAGTLSWFDEEGRPWGRVVFLAWCVAGFGWATGLWLVGPRWLRPRIVPYFARELGRHDGDTARAFRRGRGLYRELAALDGLAEALGVALPSSFGFAYDHFGQEVRWHAAAEGLRTVEALRAGLDARLGADGEVVEDLAALAAVLEAAAGQHVPFSLLLRLHGKDSLQGVMTREERQGSFW